MSVEQVSNYDACKSAILQFYSLNAEAYRRKFRQAKRLHDESCRMLTMRLKDLLGYFLEARNVTSFELLQDEILAEQLVQTLEPETKGFVMNKQAKCSEQVAEFADLFADMQRNNCSVNGSQKPVGAGSGTAQNKGKYQSPLTQLQRTVSLTASHQTGIKQGPPTMLKRLLPAIIVGGKATSLLRALTLNSTILDLVNVVAASMHQGLLVIIAHRVDSPQILNVNKALLICLCKHLKQRRIFRCQLSSMG